MKTRIASFCLIFLQPTIVLAGRPLFTDDATLTEDHSCQLESWWQTSKISHEFWALPACNPFGNFEITAGINTLKVDHFDLARNYILQGKTLFRPLENGSYGYGLAFGVTRPDQGSGGTDYAYIPLSIMSDNGKTVADFNLGWSKDRILNDNLLIWGLGAQHAWSARFSTFGEVFGDSSTDPTIHLGASIGLIPERVQLDVTYGHSFASDNSGNFYSVGINFYLPQ